MLLACLVSVSVSVSGFGVRGSGFVLWTATIFSSSLLFMVFGTWDLGTWGVGTWGLESWDLRVES